MEKHQLSDSEQSPSSKRSKHNDDAQESNSEMEEESMMESEEEEFENTQARNWHNTQKTLSNSTAEAGYLTCVKLENFMCHESCQVDLICGINFVVGNNGSGKSAVLAGITMCLGGTARATDRATSAKGFVRDGKAYSNITVTIANRGSGAFKPQIYGDVIIVERKLVAEGSGGHYKTRGANGKTIGTKLSDVQDITDYYNIQVDNPLTVLTQDNARKFLTESTAGSKYSFFLEGTQLKQLAAEYEDIKTQTQIMGDSTDLKAAVLPELLDAYKKSKEISRQSKAAIGQLGDLDRLKNESAWAHINEMEEKYRYLQSGREEKAKRLEKFDQATLKFEQNLGDTNGQIAEIDAAIEFLDTNQASTQLDAEAVTARLKVLVEKSKALRAQLRTVNVTINDMRENVTATDAAIVAEKLRLERDSGAENKPILAKMKALELEKEELLALVVKIKHQMETETNDNEPLRQKFLEVKEEMNGCKDKIDRVSEELRHAERSGGRPIDIYSQDIIRLYGEIERERGWLSKPIGPVGLYVQVKEPKYNRVLETFFSVHLNAFIVENQQDKQRLSRLARLVQCKAPIITQRYDRTFDCRSGEPDEQYSTVRRVLNYTNQLVEQVSITALAIEKAILVEKRADGDVLMRNPPRNVLNCSSMDLFRIGGIAGGSSTITMPDWTGQPRLSRDIAGRINSLKSELSNHQQNFQGLQQQFDTYNLQLAGATRANLATKNRIIAANRDIQKVDREIFNLDGSLIADTESNLDQLEERKREIVDELTSAERQVRPLGDSARQADLDCQPVKDEVVLLQSKLKGYADAMNKANAAKGPLIDEIIQLESSLTQYKRKRLETVETVNELDRELNDFATQLQGDIVIAESLCDRPISTVFQTTAKLESRIQAIQQHLKEHNKKIGRTVEEINQELKIRAQVAHQAQNAIADLRGVLKALDVALEIRKHAWQGFLTQIATRTKMGFIENLSNRGMSGKIQFDHIRCLLHFKIITAAAAASGLKGKEVLGLSGGEKSFSLVSLLITLWQSVGSPLRCLDEFDVFMDAVNRRQSVNMLIRNSNENPHIQFIVISPQALNAELSGNSSNVKIIKMRDPRVEK